MGKIEFLSAYLIAVPIPFLKLGSSLAKTLQEDSSCWKNGFLKEMQ